MAEPKKRMTGCRSGKRRSHWTTKTKSLGKCPKCQEPIMPHMVCKNCGTYRGKQVLNLTKKDKKKDKSGK